jgi:hypothetical protein
MIAPLAKLIEWASVQATFRRMPHPEGRLQLDEAIQFLNGPDFMPVESQPAQLVFDDASRLWAALSLRGALAKTTGDYPAAWQERLDKLPMWISTGCAPLQARWI